MNLAVSLLPLIVAATGWHYLFYSRAVKVLEDLETRELHLRRVLCRRINGGLFIVLGVLTFCGTQSLRPALFVFVWLAVMAILALIIVLAIVDLRLTSKLARSQPGGPDQ